MPEASIRCAALGAFLVVAWSAHSAIGTRRSEADHQRSLGESMAVVGRINGEGRISLGRSATADETAKVASFPRAIPPNAQIL
jgi:hypothetical protein